MQGDAAENKTVKILCQKKTLDQDIRNCVGQQASLFFAFCITYCDNYRAKFGEKTLLKH